MTNCEKGNLGYECTRCPKKSVYVGETSRTAFTRLAEHMGDYRDASSAKLPAQINPPLGWFVLL